MVELTNAQIDAALERGLATRLTEPRAVSCRYDRAVERVIVKLANGCVFAFPPKLAEGLDGATDEQLVQVEILGSGSGLHWGALDADLLIPGLLVGLFGTRAYMARQGGRPIGKANR